MKYILAAICLACVVGCQAQLRIESKPAEPTGDTITGIITKVEWLEDTVNNNFTDDFCYTVITFEDGRVIKLFDGRAGAAVFHYGKEHTLIYDKDGELLKVDVGEINPLGSM